MSKLHRLADELAAHLRDRIITGDISGGTSLAEAGLAQEYGVARPTARAAIEILFFDGLVQKKPHMPAVVSIVSPEDISEILGLLVASENLALERVLHYEPDVRPLRKLRDASTYSLLDKLVELAESERLHSVHRRSTYELLLAQLHQPVAFVDDDGARHALVEAVMTVDYAAARSALAQVQKVRDTSVKSVVDAVNDSAALTA
ncbi:MAG: GntR family transcriptional regulator [Arcanobacterium sp.]|nr:GntR family transcriptional regulator [Arcanobacterium sp.]